MTGTPESANTGTLPPLSAERLGGPAPDRLTVDEAMERIVDAFTPLDALERLPARQAIGRVLVEDIAADADIPPFTNVAVDGYAVRAEDVAMAARDRVVRLRVLGTVIAGIRTAAPLAGLERGQAYRVLTGAPLPPGADAVVPYEDTDGTGFGGWSESVAAQPTEITTLETTIGIYKALEPWANIRFFGEDQRKGEVSLRAGTTITPAVIGALASLGRTEVWVRRRPRVAILSTGNEIVPAGTSRTHSQVRDVNGPTLAALVEQYGGEPLELGIAPDDAMAVTQQLDGAVAGGVDLILTSGGVSMGDHDVVKRVLRERGQIAFWSVDIRPGRPLTYGRYLHVPAMALPGNPVAVMVTFELFVRPALLRLAGHSRWRKVELQATALQSISNRSGRENFMRGIVERRDHPGAEPEWTVRLTGEQGSGIVTSMVRANGLVRLVKGQTRIEPGQRVPVFMLAWEPLW